ncbi:MAG TPA: glycoside hydrolase family 2 TIM barrel-domain containing protein [Puia sp.]
MSRCFAGDTISLAGEWRFQIDRDDKGMGKNWETVKLPGSMMENGKGDDITVNTKWTASIYDSSWFFDPRMAKYRQPDNLKIPFWLTPPKYYVGAAWYQREVVIPAGWKGRPVHLFLERPHSETTVWIDGAEIGQQYGFCTEQVFDLGSVLKPGRHVVTLRIDNRIKAINVGQDSHSLTDQTQGNWNGVVGKLLLTASAGTWVDDVQVYPDVKGKKARVRLMIRSLASSGSGEVVLSGESFNTDVHLKVAPLVVKYNVKNGKDSMVVDLPMGEKVALWDEFDPALYRLTVRLRSRGAEKGAVDDGAIARGMGGDARTVEFGMREFTVRGRQFEVNGRPVYLRGTVENCVFPLTGYAPMDEASWERVFRIARAFGLNHMRFHSYCPPEAAFEAADRVGFYLQPEGPSWANHGSSLGDGKPIDEFIFDETSRMAVSYGNHASFCMLAYGNEPRGGHQVEYLTRFIHYWKEKDPRRVYTGASVANSWPLVPDNEYMIKSGARGLSWNGLPESMTDYSAVIERFTMPYVTHEMGQWCVFPDFSEIPKYTGVYKEKNFELFQELLQEQGMGDEAGAFLRASGKLQALCYKAEIEKSLRTRGGAGFQLLCLNDYTGQGTALVGVLNAFWEEKGYISAREFSRFCNSTVPLVRMPKFVYTSDEALTAQVEMYHYGAVPLRGAVVEWVVKGEGDVVVGKGEFDPKDVPIGNCFSVGAIRVSLKGVRKASRLRLEVGVRGTSFFNDWDVWVYPARVAAPGGAALRVGVGDSVYYCTELDDKAKAVLDNGGRVFLNAAGKVVKGKEVVMNFTPVFWNTSWFKMRPPHTLGLLIDSSSAAFGDFPTSYWSDLQWYDVLKKAQVMHLEDFPAGFRPLVQPIDTWFLNRRLGLIFEARVGKGRLVVSGADLSPEVGADRPAARQLYYSLLKYMASDRFKPSGMVDYKVVKDLFETPSRFVFSPYTKGGPDELKPAARIDRKALVSRHNVINTRVDTMASLTVGNGRFAYTVDVTGLQSFPEAYEKGVPLGTESEWGWHSFVDSAGYRFDEALKSYKIHGRAVSYAVQWSKPERNKKASDWFRENLHRLQLGNIGLELKKKDGSPAGLRDLQDIHQELDLWTGEIRSHFTLEGVPVDVRTVGETERDGIAVHVVSPLLREGRLMVRIRFPYPTGGFSDVGDNWKRAELHRSVLVSRDEKGAVLRHDLDTTHYFLGMKWSGGVIEEKQAHYFLVRPGVGDQFEMDCRFSKDEPGVLRGVAANGGRVFVKEGGGAATGVSFAAAAAASAAGWADYWTKGGAVDFSGSSDPRAFELERRVVLSQYLMRVQEAGDYPPQETGLTYNSWYGKPHLEMHWWHCAHFALWGHPELLERSLDWYAKVAGEARGIAQRQGYKGIRWQKMTDPEGRESPSSVGAFLIWQQPHFIYLTELCYRAEKSRASMEAGRAVLEKYKDLVFATADFMVSYAWYDAATRRYILGNGVIPAQERFKEDSTFNPCFELAYWRWALATAQEWRARLGMAPDTSWQRVEKGLAELPHGEVEAGGVSRGAERGAEHAGGARGVMEQLYFPTESATDAYTNPRYRTDHPAVLGTFGFLPATKGLDTAMMRRTFNWIDRNWSWGDTWGWDFPLTAMSATRLGLPDKAVDALLMPVKKNTYLPDGHNYQDDRLRCYLPGNGGLLSAIALMCAGYDGKKGDSPGIPKDGKWVVRWEGLNAMP